MSTFLHRVGLLFVAADPGGGGGNLLLETGDATLLESGDNILLED